MDMHPYTRRYICYIRTISLSSIPFHAHGARAIQADTCTWTHGVVHDYPPTHYPLGSCIRLF
eukprot:5454-Eustigmatos_ZCMA.PRE.1